MSRTSALLSLGAFAALTQAANFDVRTSGLAFVPSTVTAAVGDTVTFHFTNNAHDVAQGSFDAPCSPASGGFYSGMDVSGKKFVVTVENTDPIYFYCSIPGHCQARMVGGINAPDSGNTVSAFGQSASSASRSTSPDAVAGGQLLDESAVVSGASSTTAAAASTTTETSAASTSASATSSSASAAASSAVSSASSALSSLNSAASSAVSSISSAASAAASSIRSAATTTPSATQSPSAANSLIAGSEYANGKIVLSALAAALAGGVFFAGLI